MDRFVVKLHKAPETCTPSPVPSVVNIRVEVDELQDNSISKINKEKVQKVIDNSESIISQKSRKRTLSMASLESIEEEDLSMIDIIEESINLDPPSVVRRHSTDSVGSTEVIKIKKRSTSGDRYVDITKLKDRKEYEWLIRDKYGKPYCSGCGRNILGGTFHIDRHAGTQLHLSKFKQAKETPLITTILEKNPQTVMDMEIRRVELKMVMQVVEHNLPFLFLDHYPDFLRSCFKNSDIAKRIKCARTKGTKLVTTILAPASIEEAASDLQTSKYSIIIDETTDISTCQCLAIVARYYCQQYGVVRDRFLGVIEVIDATANGLFTSICTFLSENNIPLSNMIGFASDNAAVMRGHLNGVVAKLKTKLPWLFSLGCICHSFNLCASSAADKKLPKTVEDLARDVNNYFCHSSKRLNKFFQLQSLANAKHHRLLKLANTRWLSLEAVVKRMIEQWDVLETFFQEAVKEDNLQNASTILHALQSPDFKLYYLFLAYVLDLVNRLNVEFQSEKPKLYTLLPRIAEVYKTLLKNYLKKTYVDNTKLNDINCSHPYNFLAIENIYYGAKVEIFLTKNQVSSDIIKSFKVRALDYYVQLCTEIHNRINFEDPVLTQIQLLNPKTALNGDSPSILPLVQLFPNVVKESNYEALNSEWRMLPEVAQYFKDDETFENFIKLIGKLKNALEQKMFPHLSEFLMAIASLPHSSAAAERVFSQFKLIKTPLRNRMAIDTCDALLLCKELLFNKVCSSWEPSNELLKRKPKDKVCEILDSDIFESD